MKKSTCDMHVTDWVVYNFAGERRKKLSAKLDKKWKIIVKREYKMINMMDRRREKSIKIAF